MTESDNCVCSYLHSAVRGDREGPASRRPKSGGDLGRLEPTHEANYLVLWAQEKTSCPLGSQASTSLGASRLSSTLGPTCPREGAAFPRRVPENT